MNQHNPPTEAEVRAALWVTNQRLRGQVNELQEHLGKVIDAYDDGTEALSRVITEAETFLEESRCNQS